MKITTLTPDALRSRIASDGAALGANVSDDALRDVLRGELRALGAGLRRTLIDRLVDRVAVEGDDRSALRERLGELLEGLASSGDVYVGAGGLVGAAPLRAALVSDTLALLVGSASTVWLRRNLAAVSIEAGPIRRAQIAPGERSAFENALSAHGGTVTTVTRWAGLDRVPREIAAWRAELAERFDGAAHHDRFEPGDDVRIYMADPLEPVAARRWKFPAKLASKPSPRLERHRRPGGWFAYAWVIGETLHPLSRDEGLRTSYLFDAEAGASRPLRTSTFEESVFVDLDAMLPSPEYRLLLGVGTRVDDSNAPRRWRVPMTAWPELRRALAEGLGIRIDEGA